MNIKRALGSKKYLFRIYLWIISVVCILIGVMSAFFYYNVQEKVLDNEYKNSQKILYQMKYNMEYMDDMTRNLLLSIYNNFDVRALMYLNEDESYDNMNVINKLNNTTVRSNPYVHSVYIYNNNKKRYYSTFGDFIHKDSGWEELLKSEQQIPLLKPIIRTMEVGKGNDGLPKYERVLSFVMYELLDDKKNMDGAVILNIKLEWLFNNIKAINSFDDKNTDKLFILDENKQYFEVSPQATSEGQDLKIKLKDKVDSLQASGVDLAKESSKFFTLDIEGVKNLVTYTPIEDTGWMLFKTVPYASAYEYVNKLKTSMIVITLIILAVALIVAISISRGLYRPVDRLIRQIRTNESEGLDAVPSFDEFSFLQEVYTKSADQLESYKRDKNSNEGIMKFYFLRKLLLNSNAISEAEFEEACQSYGLTLTRDRYFAVCILKIDNYTDFVENRSTGERELVRFAVMNITSEIVAKAFSVEIVDMKNDHHLAMIINIDPIAEQFEDELSSLIKQAQLFLLESYKLSISSSVSVKTTNYQELTTAYDQALNTSLYRFVYGKMSITFSSLIRINHVILPVEKVIQMQIAFIESVKRGDISTSQTHLYALLDTIKKLEYSDMILALMHVVNQLKNAIYEINQSRTKPVNVNSVLVGRELLELETMEEFQLKIEDMLKEIKDGIQEESNKQDAMTAETIKEIIEANYMNMEMSTSEIATMLRISPTKIGKLFKENTNMTITEYMNHVRLLRAVEWLENSKLNISDIMLKVGFENESYFYKVFKAKFGTTPREYILRRTKDRL